MSVRPLIHKSVSDPIHGVIPLTELEVRLMDTRAFQRLRRVGQLGLADLVFPSADYSRFAHSLGACHILGQIMDVLSRRAGESITEHAWIEHRAAMLLHDVGHYPMSHATEAAVERYYEKQSTSVVGSEVEVTPVAHLDHEKVGTRILRFDTELNGILKDAGLDPERIGRIFAGEERGVLNNLVSSELDADRLDYLMRSSQATGLPYGHYDREYLIESMRFDKTGRVCLGEKALRAADHFLLCRSFDYLQVVFHKTIVGMEQLLQRLVRRALDAGFLRLAETDVEAAIKNGTWYEWDDAWLRHALVDLGESTDDPLTRAMVKRLIHRDPPPCLFAYEAINPKGSDRAKELKRFVQVHVGKDRNLGGNVLPWFKRHRPTDVSPYRRSGEQDDEELEQKSIQIERFGIGTPLVQCDKSLMSVLGGSETVMARVYFAGPPEDYQETLQKVRQLAELHETTDWVVHS